MMENELRAGIAVPSNGDDESHSESNELLSEDHAEEPHQHSHPPRRSCIGYTRPLFEGERVEYEFYHQPNVHNASLSIDRLAYHLRDGKVLLQWITSSDAESDPESKLPPTGADPEAENLAPVMLEVNAWNRMQVRIERVQEVTKVVLAINGMDVYRRALNAESLNRFGFYCDPEKDDVRIRKVMLSGDWPAELPADLWELRK